MKYVVNDRYGYVNFRFAYSRNEAVGLEPEADYDMASCTARLATPADTQENLDKINDSIADSL